MIIQFQGEDRKEAITNHFSLDIEQEDLFFLFVTEMGYSIEDEDAIIENLHKMWLSKQNKI